MLDLESLVLSRILLGAAFAARRRSFPGKTSFLIQAPAGIPSNFPTGGFRYCVRRDKFNYVGGQAKKRIDTRYYLSHEFLAFHLVNEARFCDNHDLFGSRLSVAYPESCNTPTAYPRDFACDLLDLLRVKVTPSFQDEIFGSACHKEFAIGQVAKISRVDPSIIQNLPCCLLITIVALHHGRPAKLDSSLIPVLKDVPLHIHNSNLMGADRRPHRGKLKRVGTSMDEINVLFRSG